MRFRPVIFISPSKFLICICFVLLLGYVVLKHAVERKPKIPAVATFIVDKQTGDDGQSAEFFHKQFNAMSDCRAIFGMSMERKSERVDTFKATGAIIKIDLLSLYADSNNSKLVEAKVSCLQASRDCRIDVYAETKLGDSINSGCGDLRPRCQFEVTCKRKSFFGMTTEVKNYVLQSNGLIMENE